ncbi:hypothetical protein [Aliarcobacter butzleri]|uniref:hypothetical protein n=1 Tax=Aliarcobacter butzleri TaxID=28197 RepID=UPI001D01F4D8|nr:hypothetical protein [Aliarcobacter butzleri]
MLLKSKYKVVVLITILLIFFSILLSVVNYIVSLNNAQNQLKEQALPLSLDNIYTDIQKNIIQPYLVSSMMANDTFVQEWLTSDEENNQRIERYLEAIKNKYDMFNTFLVSDKTKNYYTQSGFVEKVDEKNGVLIGDKSDIQTVEIKPDIVDKISKTQVGESEWNNINITLYSLAFLLIFLTMYFSSRTSKKILEMVKKKE